MRKKDKKDNKKGLREESLFDKRLEKKPKSNKGSLGEKILLVVLGVIIAAAGVFAGKYSYNLIAGGNDTTTTTSTSTTVSTTTKAQTTTTTKSEKGQEVTITSDLGLNMRESADTDSEVLEIIPPEETVTVLDEQGDWYQVEYNGQTGWISSEFTE